MGHRVAADRRGTTRGVVIPVFAVLATLLTIPVPVAGAAAHFPRAVHGAATDVTTAAHSTTEGVPTTVPGAVVRLAGSAVAAAPAASPTPVSPDFFGVHDDARRPLDPQTWSTGRLWAAWCTVQPQQELDVVKAARKALRKTFREFAASGTRRLTVSLGHPAPWVFGSVPAAEQAQPEHVWYCSKYASVTSFPRARTLRGTPLGQAYAAYVAAVIRAATPYLAADPRNRLVLQAWNEPNLLNGGTITRKIPGAAATWNQAAASLQEQERIIWSVASGSIPGRFEVSSPALYGKPTELGDAYLARQARSRTIDSVSLNLYTLRQRSVNTSLERWRTKARIAKRLVTSHQALKYLPIWMTETNHNLVNAAPEASGTPTAAPDDSNLTGAWATPAAQRRLVEVTTMEALRLRFAGLQWYQGTPAQTAVSTLPGSPAAEAVTALRAELVGRMLLGCGTEGRMVTCSFSERGSVGPVQVQWSRTDDAGVTLLR